MRIAAEMLTHASDQTLQQLYFITDFALLFGIGGIYWLRMSVLGPGGSLSFALFLFGILLVRSNQVSFFGVHGYRAGATMLLRRVLRVAPLFWFASLALGLTGALGFASALLIVSSGILFGPGCIAAGIEAVRGRTV